jgi:hypothetical protein
MPISRLRAAAALTFAFIAASCGGDGSTGPTFADSVSTSDAIGVAVDAGYIAGDIAYALHANGPTIGLAAPAMAARAFQQGKLADLPARVKALAASMPALRLGVSARPAGLQLSSSEGCTLTVHGTMEGTDGYVDVNANGVPDDLYYKEDCHYTDSTSSDTVFFTHFLLEQTARDHMGSLYGFSASFRYEYVTTDEFGNTWQGFTYAASEALDILAGGATHHVTWKVRGWDDVSGVLDEGTSGEDFDASFDPSGTIALANPIPDGNIDFTARDYFTDTSDGNVSFGLETTTPLAFDSSCYDADTNPPFVGGVIRGRLNNNASQASFTATFTACGTPPTVAVNGAFDEALTTR